MKAGILRALRRWLRDTGGNVAVMLALALVPLSLAALGAVDVQRVVSTKSELQDALDAAALTAARDSVADPTKLQEFGAAAFAANIRDTRLTIVSGPTFTLTNERVVVADASARVGDTILAKFALGSDFTVNAHAEVNSSGANVEVSMVLDLTDSMDAAVPGCTSKIACLKTAATNLIDLVVQDNQTPFYSKMAIVPYSYAVDVDAYASVVRGSPASSFSFTGADNQPKTFHLSDCVTERTGAHAYTDAPVTTAYVGRHYTVSGTCLNAPVSPLSSDKAALKARVASFDTAGSTAGQIGLAWGWYLVSPTFMGGWQNVNSRPAPYGTDKLMKFVVLMTDGMFNTVYCKGVKAQNSLGGSGGSNEKINCNSENGLPFDQATSLCNAIKARGIIIYTVLLDVSDPAAVAFMRSCATDSARVYLPTTGGQLKDAFASIGADITKLRLSR
ncbi:TadE/TadG family type IV pilus assembly protein [Phenylobacterium sp.]|jgi:Flp pilus assembly protein TadG|uniref:TadE/TadG family type IV pilus assembly protein n=1 Tax=Phenylobacterium sp. TaxID=1871053 RepID=UPI002F9484CC